MTTRTIGIWLCRHRFKSVASYFEGITLIITVAAYLRDFMLMQRREPNGVRLQLPWLLKMLLDLSR